MSGFFLSLRICQVDLEQTPQLQATSTLIEPHSPLCSDVSASMQITQLSEYLHLHAEAYKSLLTVVGL